MVKTLRKDEFNKINVSVIFDAKQSFTFGIVGSTWRFTSTGVNDDTHRRISSVFHTFVNRSTLKIVPAIKLNQVQNLGRTSKDFHDFLIRFNENTIYSMPLSANEQDVIDAVEKSKADPKSLEAITSRSIKSDQKGKEAKKRALQRIASMPAPSSKEKVKRAPVAPFQAKYEYPEGMSAEDKKKHRAKMRADAKKGK